MTKYLSKASLSQNLEKIKIINMVETLLNPSYVFSLNTGCPLRQGWRDRIPQSFVHANVIIIVTVFIFFSSWRRFAFNRRTGFLFLANFTFPNVILCKNKQTTVLISLSSFGHTADGNLQVHFPLAYVAGAWVTWDARCKNKETRAARASRARRFLPFPSRVLLAPSAFPNTARPILIKRLPRRLISPQTIVNYHKLSCAWSNEKNYHQLPWQFGTR